jgi:tetratricopeptide (TPR) repeat protein
MTPGGTSDEKLMVEQVERLGARRLAEIVVNHCHRDERLHQTVRIALAASTLGGPLVKTLATEIDAVRASRHFYGYRESNVLAQELDRIRQGITEYLLPAQPRAAAELLGRLIRLDANVYERSDDSDGVIGDAIGEAVTDCGRAWAAVPERDPKVLAGEVFNLFTTDEYGARSEVITAFSEALGTSGLDELERMVRERLDHAPAGKYGYRQRALTIALENIADARGDVDGYIAAQRLAGTEGAAVQDIGERLLAAGRLEEALQWLDRADIPEHNRGDIGPLKVDILDRLGRTEDAQAVRWSIFATSLSADILDEYLGRLPEDVVAEARQRAIATACRHPDVHQSLPLLAELSPDIAAELVHMRLGEIRGEAYWTLRPVAERLRESHPVAAILLYRQMADAVLQRGQSQYYDHAVRDLIAAERLVPKVEDWLDHRPQEAYRQHVGTEHRQKRAFWERMGRAGLSWRQ